MAPGSHEWKGTCADFVKAPASTRAAAIPTVGPLGGDARISLNVYVPAAWPSSTNPPSMASPPAPVMSSAWSAAARAGSLVSSKPISRYEVIEVSSQQT